MLLHEPQTDVYLGKGVRHDRPVDPSRQRAPAKPERPKFDYAGMLIDEHRKQLDREARGIGYLSAMRHADRRWPFTEFVQRLASRLGKSALVRAFLKELEGPGWEVVYVHLTHLPSAGLLKLLVSRLDKPPRRGKDRLFQQILDHAASVVSPEERDSGGGLVAGPGLAVQGSRGAFLFRLSRLSGIADGGQSVDELGAVLPMRGELQSDRSGDADSGSRLRGGGLLPGGRLAGDRTPFGLSSAHSGLCARKLESF